MKSDAISTGRLNEPTRQNQLGYLQSTVNLSRRRMISAKLQREAKIFTLLHQNSLPPQDCQMTQECSKYNFCRKRVGTERPQYEFEPTN